MNEMRMIRMELRYMHLQLIWSNDLYHYMIYNDACDDMIGIWRSLCFLYSFSVFRLLPENVYYKAI